MNLIELNRALGQLRLGGIAAVLETRLRQAQAEAMPPIDFLSCLVSDELTRRGERLLERRKKQAEFRDAQKTLDNFDFNFNRKMNRSLVFDLATGAFIARHEDGLFLGPPGTGKSHLATGLAISACRQRRRVRFTTAAALVNQLVEAQREQSLSRMLARWSRVELIVIDELGYVPLAEVAAELLFQIIAERAEKAAVIVTTNLPFSEWPQVFTNARLCKAMLDRLTDRAHIIETGSESYRFRRTLRKKTKD